ncbi:S8 family serine peptidase [Leptothoe kymatousa]|uniref:S8 family serine peptidase n=1 Tax=Leptothoe kymatousa TAU-MAC 1615 TaxID=2364775 RepID=A0ABS5XYG5_9CYAN|nr:S8 family serine peptidase [Leptothoe kymatousa]MBT9310628.1 S8 family serine peptidase [Leptothoe kymatousa TAU-MAC 1615]
MPIVKVDRVFGVSEMVAGESLQGVNPEQAGLILQRGGEELWLYKVANWLTLRFEDLAEQSLVLEDLTRQWQPLEVRSVAQGQLVALKVKRQQLEDYLQRARQLPQVRFASHVYELAASPNTHLYLLEQLTVQFAANFPLREIDALGQELGLIRTKGLAGVERTYVFQVGPSAMENPIKLANRLMRHAAVLVAEPNVVISTAPLYRPQDNLYRQQWHLQHQGGRGLVVNSHISAEKAWDITRGSRSVVVAVTDDAFDLNHPDLQGMGKLVGPRDLKNKDGLPMPAQSYENHGTSVAGLAVAEETGSGVVGVAPGCSFMPIQTTGFLDDESIEQLFDWAVAQGAAVISCSWSPAAVYFPLSFRQRNAINRAATRGRNGKGCVVLFSAGNANRPLNGKVQELGWPRNALRGVTQWLGGFAMHPDVITVSATTSLNRKAVYSNWGKQVSVAAPSNNGPPSMALPNVGQVETGPPVKGAMAGLGMTTCDRTGQTGYSRSDYTSSFGGTSSACPVVAGVVGLMLSANPDLSAAEVKQILQDTADKIEDTSPDPQLGLAYGRYDNRGHSLWFGYGKVNAYRAVKACRDRYLSTRRLSKTLEQTSAVTLTIPASRTDLQRAGITINQRGNLQDIQVYVDLRHPFLGDLSVSLRSPQGRTVLLQGRTLGRQTQLRKTYTFENTPALTLVMHEGIHGRWQLDIVDHTETHPGQLLQWSLKLGI